MKEKIQADDVQENKFELAFNQDRKYLLTQALFLDYEITEDQKKTYIPKISFNKPEAIHIIDESYTNDNKRQQHSRLQTKRVHQRQNQASLSCQQLPQQPIYDIEHLFPRYEIQNNYIRAISPMQVKRNGQRSVERRLKPVCSCQVLPSFDGKIIGRQ
ncbi:hypothetical protein SS50377_25895 [Spironucleus salmonicida]|uniref:Uncharacterized protein n=1 Tax=Spironucleus salmonicida TaxID=348837 RepID=V6LRP6_9EUKA|nr:hypothetical protein SS50377_25895 [Spironucleus salmonicida]|eukprot:EST47332.1 Hypothetical protein SS50377_12603 [Spironucleus salmonicida]